MIYGQPAQELEIRYWRADNEVKHHLNQEVGMGKGKVLHPLTLDSWGVSLRFDSFFFTDFTIISNSFLPSLRDAKQKENNPSRWFIYRYDDIIIYTIWYSISYWYTHSYKRPEETCQVFCLEPKTRCSKGQTLHLQEGSPCMCPSCTWLRFSGGVTTAWLCSNTKKHHEILWNPQRVVGCDIPGSRFF